MAADNSFTKLNASDLTAIILKGSPLSSTYRDAGFCSGSSETDDDLQMDHSRLEPHSPTDASEDSIEVKVIPIIFGRNKRKSTEPSRVICGNDQGPLKKRIRYASLGESQNETDSKYHFRPWDQNQLQSHEIDPAEILIRHPGVTTLHRRTLNNNNDNDDHIQKEPLALITKKPSSTITSSSTTSTIVSEEESHSNRISLDNFHNNNETIRSTNHHRLDLFNIDNDSDIPLTVENDNNNDNNNNTNLDDDNSNNLGSVPLMTNFSSSSSVCSHSQRPQQRNYKNMTRERRIEANARERTRVHTISAAYEKLRKAVPAYSDSQKLSKLSVLKVACSYILALSRMAGFDYSEDQNEPMISECIDLVTKTILTEGKIRKKKDD